VFAAVRNIFKIQDLRKKIFITLALLIVYRIGSFVPTPGINTQALSAYFEDLSRAQGQTFLGMINLFTGGALRRLSIFALGIMPYISASIIMQLLQAVVPMFERLAHQGRTGMEKINQYTRYGTLVLCVFQGYMLSRWLENPASFGGVKIVPNPGLGFELMTVLTLACGTVFIMWLGEQIQEKGIGNGISLIIATSIISRIPSSFSYLWMLYSPLDPAKRQISTVEVVMMLLLWFVVVMGVVFFSQAQRRIPIQYARRVVGRRVYGGQSTYLPIRIDMAGVIAIIFAQSVLLFPATVANFLPQSGGVVDFIKNIFRANTLWYNVGFVVLIFFFMYFYTAIVFNPVEIANNLKKYGGFIPGIRPGRKTTEYIDYVASRIVFVGAIYIAIIAIFPSMIINLFNIPSYAIASFFGGTTILIMVGVILDTMRQIEGQLTVRHYEGFVKGNALKARR
jgi:preprotein translocase subunit SecY